MLLAVETECRNGPTIRLASSQWRRLRRADPQWRKPSGNPRLASRPSIAQTV